MLTSAKIDEKIQVVKNILVDLHEMANTLIATPNSSRAEFLRSYYENFVFIKVWVRLIMEAADDIVALEE